MTVSIIPPYPSFVDLDGIPIDGGFIYCGTENLNPLVEANRISIFSDAALTVPLANPVSTSGGFALDTTGSPCNIYAATNFSISVCDRNNVVKVSALSYGFRILSDAITFDTVVIGTSILPDAAGGAFNGTVALPWSSTVARAIQARTLNIYSQTQPAVTADFGRLTQLSMDVLVCSQTSVGAVAALVNNLNTASITRTAAGTYTVVPTVALPATYNLQLTSRVFSAGTTPLEIVCTTRGTASLVIESRINNVNIDLAWDLLIKANPAVADPIS